MINGIGSSSFDYQLNSVSGVSSNSSNSLSLEQQQTIDDVLSQYDSDSLSESDAQAIVAAFSDAGISPSKQLEDAMDSLGFDAREVGDLAGVGPQGGSQAMGGMPPPPPPPPSQSDEEEFDTVSSLLDTLFSSDEEEDSESSSSFEDLMEYTSRIVNLNDSSKNSVMSLLEQYSSEDNELSQEQTSSLVKNALNSILADSNNYNHTSFYG